jgi:hypothetical protein
MMFEGRSKNGSDEAPVVVSEWLVDALVWRLCRTAVSGLAVALDLGGVGVAEPQIKVFYKELHHVSGFIEELG